MSSVKLLVTGGAGFIGANFILHVLAERPNWLVINLDALTYAGDEERLAELKGDKRYRFVHGSILDEKLVDELMGEVQTVVHFAAESHVDRSIANPRAFAETNVIGTLTLLNAAVKHKKRFHHVSTDEVYGSLPLHSNERFTEATPYDPRSPYSASKAASDHFVRAWYETYDLPITISNCSNNYGLWQSPDRIIPLFIHNALRDQPLPIYGAGQAVRDYLHVIDHCRGILLILEKGEIGQTYLIGGGAEKSGVETARTILEATGKPDSLIQFVQDRPGHDMRYAVDYTKIHRELGYQPSKTFEEGMAETVEWYQRHGQWTDHMMERMAEFKKGFHT